MPALQVCCCSSTTSNTWAFKACLSKLHACRCHASAGTIAEPPLEVRQKSTEGKNVVEILRSRGLVQVCNFKLHPPCAWPMQISRVTKYWVHTGGILVHGWQDMADALQSM